jgi:hypothetical protein
MVREFVSTIDIISPVFVIVYCEDIAHFFSLSLCASKNFLENST